MVAVKPNGGNQYVRMEERSALTRICWCMLDARAKGAAPEGAKPAGLSPDRRPVSSCCSNYISQPDPPLPLRDIKLDGLGRNAGAIKKVHGREQAQAGVELI